VRHNRPVPLTASPPRILVVEDDPTVSEVVTRYLEREGFVVEVAYDGADGLARALADPPELVVLDLMIPTLDGFEVCRRLRAAAPVPVIMLTARGEEADRIRGLETGADDYVTKPFSPRELIARVGAVLRRVRPALAGERLSYADIEMDVVSHKAKRGGKTLALGPTEFRLLRHFLEHPGRVFSRERLLDQVWAHDSDIELRTVDVHIRRLRKALNEGGRPDLIRTVRAAGYSLDDEGA